jgi:hypothetical protein
MYMYTWEYIVKFSRRHLRQLIHEQVAAAIEQGPAQSQLPPGMDVGTASQALPAGAPAMPPTPQEPQGGLSVAGMTAETDISSISSQALADALFSGAPNDLYNAIATATGWASKPLKKLGADTPAGLKALALSTFGPDETTARTNFVARADDIKKSLAQSQGFPKTEMPALEGSDIDELTDALSPGGMFQVDAQDTYKDSQQDFDKWYAKSGVGPTSPAEIPGGSNVMDMMSNTQEQQPSPMLERWNRLAGLNRLDEINQDPRFPFPGAHTVMSGAPAGLDSKADIPEDQITGKAKAFLTKGLGTGGDAFPITPNQPLTNSQMKPTQTNVKAGKSILFALADIGQDMEGAYATTDGEILDGHHRWSGQYLRTGGDVQMQNVHLIDKSGMTTPAFLTMLTVIGNALGRPTKLKQ